MTADTPSPLSVSAGDRYLEFVALGREGRYEWRVRTYGASSSERIEEIRNSVADAYEREHGQPPRRVNVGDWPYVEGLSYEPVNGFLDVRARP